MDREPVEKYKLTPEMMDFQKKFSKAKKFEQAIKSKLLVQMAGAKTLSDILRETQMGLQQALQNMPRNKTMEIEGQS